MLKRVMSSWNKSTAKNKSTECVQSPTANTKPNVARSFCLSYIIRKYLKEIIIVCYFLNFIWLAAIKLSQDEIYKNEIQIYKSQVEVYKGQTELLKSRIDELNSCNHSLTRLLNIAAKKQSNQK